MFTPSALLARSDEVTPQACKPFTIHSNVCIGDLIAIIACSIAGIGFFFWAIHAIRKMRQFPFRYPPENKEESSGESERVDPYHAPSTLDNSLLVQHGVVQAPSLPNRVRTRLALSQSEEEFYRPSAPNSNQTSFAQRSMITPRTPPPAGGQSRRSPLHSSGDHGSLRRGEPYGERYGGYGMNEEYIRNVSPSRARGSLPHKSGSGYGRTNGDPTMYAY